MEKELVLNNENLQKALEAFGLDKSLLKSNPFQTDLNKGLESNSLNSEEAQDVLYKALGVTKDSLQKALEVSKTIEDFNSSLEAKNEVLIKGLDDLGSAFKNKIDSLEKSYQSKLQESEGLIKSLQDELSTLKGTVEEIGKQPMPKKSVTTAIIQREFNSANNGTDNLAKGNDNKIVLSLTKDTNKIKNLIENKLDEALTKGNESDPFIQGAPLFDSNKILTKGILSELQKLNITIVN